MPVSALREGGEPSRGHEHQVKIASEAQVHTLPTSGTGATTTTDGATEAQPSKTTVATTQTKATTASGKNRKANARMFLYTSMAVRQRTRINIIENSRFGWLTDSQVWWRHPYMRIIVGCSVLVVDMYIYDQDPQYESNLEYYSVGMPEVGGMIFNWTGLGAGAILVKLLMIVLSFYLGILFGKVVILQKLFREQMHLAMFAGGEGGAMICIMCISFNLYVCSFLINYLLPADEQISAYSCEFITLFEPSEKWYHVGRFWNIGSTFLDVASMTMTFDLIMQDRRHYPNFALGLKKKYATLWNGYFRVCVCWGFFIFCEVMVCWAISWLKKGEKGAYEMGAGRGGWGPPTSETTRGFVASIFVGLDLLFVVQDWDFPIFRDPVDIECPTMIAGTMMSEIRCTFFSTLLEKMPSGRNLLRSTPEFLHMFLPHADHFKIRITGRWLQYGTLFVVMICDIFAAKGYSGYDPLLWGSYTDPRDNRVWVIRDQDFLHSAYNAHYSHRFFQDPMRYGRDPVDANFTSALVSFAARRMPDGSPRAPGAETDFRLNSTFVQSEGAKYFGLLVALVFVTLFLLSVFCADWKRAFEIEKLMAEAQAKNCDNPHAQALAVGDHGAGANEEPSCDGPGNLDERAPALSDINENPKAGASAAASSSASPGGAGPQGLNRAEATIPAVVEIKPNPEVRAATDRIKTLSEKAAVAGAVANISRRISYDLCPDEDVMHTTTATFERRATGTAPWAATKDAEVRFLRDRDGITRCAVFAPPDGSHAATAAVANSGDPGFLVANWLVHSQGELCDLQLVEGDSCRVEWRGQDVLVPCAEFMAAAFARPEQAAEFLRAAEAGAAASARALAVSQTLPPMPPPLHSPRGGLEEVEATRPSAPSPASDAFFIPDERRKDNSELPSDAGRLVTPPRTQEERGIVVGFI